MKIFLMILTGFVLTLGTYAGGIATAVFLLDADPVPVRSASLDAAAAWNRDVVAADAAAQDLERLQDQPIRRISPSDAEPEADETEAAASADPLIDRTTTSAIPPETTTLEGARLEPEPLEPEPLEFEPEQAEAPTVNDAHVRWCFERYRSYRPEDNSYTAYSGEQRECVSPFAAGAEGGENIRDQASVDRPFVGYPVEDAEPSGRLTPEHVQSCFDRYRSYRPEDNSYQPYGGGPRRQCR